jgi:hypothetical protein
MRRCSVENLHMYFGVFPSLYYLACSLVIRSFFIKLPCRRGETSFGSLLSFFDFERTSLFLPLSLLTYMILFTYLAISIFTLSSHFLFLAKEDELFVGVSIVSIDN